MLVLCFNLILVNIVLIFKRWYIIKELFIKYIKPFCTWRILVCYLPFWFLASGWAWLFSFIGKGWLRGIAISWLTFLWMPFCPEKLITIPLAIWLHKKIFPKHSTTSLDEMLEKEKNNKILRKEKDNA